MTCQRAEDARKLLDAAQVLDSYGYTETMMGVIACMDDVLDGKIDPAPRVEMPPPKKGKK